MLNRPGVYQIRPAVPVYVKFCDTAHRKAVPAVVVVRVGVTTVEVQVPRVAAVAGILSTGPVVAVVATVVQRAAVVVPVPGGRQ